MLQEQKPQYLFIDLVKLSKNSSSLCRCNYFEFYQYGAKMATVYMVKYKK